MRVVLVVDRLTLDGEVDGVTGGLPLTVLRPAGVASVVPLLHALHSDY